MALFSKTTLNSMDDLYVEHLQDLYDAEQRITEALPKMSDAATSPELKTAFRSHLRETEAQLERLRRIFRNLNLEPGSETCEAMKGLIKEGDEMVEAKGDPAVKDAALIAAAQRVEHYEIAGYGSARAFAQRLGRTDDADLLQQTLEEESATDKKLTQIAESSINPRTSTARGL